MKKAVVKLGWSRSVSSNVVKSIVLLNNDGTQTETEVGPEVDEIQITVDAEKSITFIVKVVDSEGLEAVSNVYNFTFGNLVPPVAPTGLFIEILSVYDV